MEVESVLRVGSAHNKRGPSDLNQGWISWGGGGMRGGGEGGVQGRGVLFFHE